MLSVKEIRISPYFFHAHLLIHTHLYPIAVLYPLDPCLLSLFPPFNKRGREKNKGEGGDTDENWSISASIPQTSSTTKLQTPQELASPLPLPPTVLPRAINALVIHSTLLPSFLPPPLFFPSFLKRDARCNQRRGERLRGTSIEGKKKRKKYIFATKLSSRLGLKGCLAPPPSYPPLCKCKADPLFSCSIFVNLSRYNRGGRDFFERGKG